MSESTRTDGLRVHTVGEVAKLLGTCTRTVYREIQSGNLRCLRIGRAIRVTDSQLTEYLAGREG